VFGRTGAVTAAANDYNFNQLAGSLASSQDYTVGSAGTYTKVTTNAQGRVSSGTQAAASDLSNGTTGSGSIVLATSPTISTPTISGALGGNLDLGSKALLIEMPNAGATGTTVNKLAKLTGAPSTAVITATSDTSGAIGIAVGGAGTSGNAQIATDGVANCVFDGATTAGDYVQISSTAGGDCKDAGSTRPTGGQIIGRVLSTNASAGTYAMTLATSGDAAGVPRPSSASVATSQSTTSTTYAALATAGPSVTVNLTSGSALVTFTAAVTANSLCNMSFNAGGFTAADAQSLQLFTGGSAVQVSATFYVTGLTAGSNTFTGVYRSQTGGTCTFANRSIIVIPY
jgi:hypothetical protein